jgi:hypothetical protein
LLLKSVEVRINAADISIIRVGLGATITIYKETTDWMNE